MYQKIVDVQVYEISRRSLYLLCEFSPKCMKTQIGNQKDPTNIVVIFQVVHFRLEIIYICLKVPTKMLSTAKVR